MSTTEDRGESQVYEIGYLVLPSIPEDKIPDTVDSIKKIIKDNGAQELDGEEPYLIDLAYPLSKTVGASKYVVKDAYFGWQKFEAEPSIVEAIKAALEKKDELIRFLLIKTTRETRFTLSKARAKIEESETEQAEEGEGKAEEEAVVE